MNPHTAIEPLVSQRVLETLPPFPVVLVTTRANIITIGQLMYFTFKPLRLGIAVAHSRHTHGLLREEGEFVVNVPGVDMIDVVQKCGSVSGRDVDKWEEVGLTAVEARAVRAVCIGECGAHIECIIEREVDFEERTWFIGRVVAARNRPGHEGMQALMCGRTHYVLPGDMPAER